MRDVEVIGVGMTRFGKYPERNMKSLAAEAVSKALEDAGLKKTDIEYAFVGNGLQGLYDGQEGIRGQVVLFSIGIGKIPIVNVENACASSSTAFHCAWMAVASGVCDVALVLGMEKMYTQDKARALSMFMADTDVEFAKMIMESIRRSEKSESGKKGKREKVSNRSIFMDFYAMGARQHMEKYGTTQEQLAIIASKNHINSSFNPYAQYQTPYTVEEVLNSPEVVYPFTRLMCSPIGDGAAAAIICSEEYAKSKSIRKPVRVLASSLGSCRVDSRDESIGKRVARKAYEMAGVEPENIDVAEVHDATAFGELRATEELGFCDEGEGGKLAERGATKLNGEIPVNPSGGLESRGHPIGATGVAQITEIVWQLRGQAGKRQVNDARIGLTHNGGGMLGSEEAALCIHIFESDF